MLFEIRGIQTSTGKRVKASVEAATFQDAVRKATSHGIVVDAEMNGEPLSSVIKVNGTWSEAKEPPSPRAEAVPSGVAKPATHGAGTQSNGPLRISRADLRGKEPPRVKPVPQAGSAHANGGPRTTTAAPGQGPVRKSGVPAIWVAVITGSAALVTGLVVAVVVLATRDVPSGETDRAPSPWSKSDSNQEQNRRAREDDPKARMASATKNAWNLIYQTDTKARAQWNADDRVGALDTIIAGYRVDSQNVDRELLTFIDEHVNTAGNLAEVLKAWNARLAKVDRDAEENLEKMIETVYRPLSRLAANPQETLDNAIAGHRLGMQFDIKNAKDKVNAQFKPRYDSAWSAFADSCRAKSRLTQSLSSRYELDFPVGLIFKE